MAVEIRRNPLRRSRLDLAEFNVLDEFLVESVFVALTVANVLRASFDVAREKLAAPRPNLFAVPDFLPALVPGIAH